MKSTIVPAQITTVEDKIAGNLSFSQLMLLMAPVLMSGLLFIVLPPFIHVTYLKLFIGGCLLLVGATLAIRYRGELVIHRLISRISYNLRPKYYVYDKNDRYLRYEPTVMIPEAPSVAQIPDEVEDFIAQLISMPERVRLESALTDPRARLQFMVKKGGLYVGINEIKD